MIKAQNISKKYGTLEVLKNIDLVVNDSEVISIVGPSGAGKSTLLHLLGTLDKPDSGQIWIDNQEITTANETEIAVIRNQKMGFIFQFHNLMAELTALENVCLPAWIAKSKENTKERANELFDILHLSHRKNHLPSEMSGGEQQRVAVARALMNQPQLIFADEPSGNLDTKNADELHHLFFEIRNKFKCAFVIVTHNDKLAKMADRQLRMQDGKIIEE
jgi:lipoprotein-releasing system ATP-binding protein